jgi:hypothetical protein
MAPTETDIGGPGNETGPPVHFRSHHSAEADSIGLEVVDNRYLLSLAR